MEFKSMGELSTHLCGIVEHIEHGEGIHHALERIGQHLEKKAKEKIGNLQPGWVELTEETEAAKARKGYRADAPLLASGEMRDSIEHEVEGNHSVIVGAKDEKMRFHEFGTASIPPRPVFETLCAENADYIQEQAAQALAAAMKRGRR